MCGIFGTAFLPQGEPVHVGAALDAIRYRGPDDRGVYEAPGVTLGFVRLAILDLSPLGHQPMLSADANVVVIFNGEIYNHHELRAELAKFGASFRSRSDTEVIVEGYRRWGEDVVRRLDGMFALAIFDVAHRKLVLARDRAGKKPLFYAEQGAGLRFGSEPGAILASGFEPRVNVRGLPELFAFGYVPAPRTLYEGMNQLPPAHMLVLVEGRRAVVTRYWRPPFAAEPLDIGVEEATREVRRLVEEAVMRRLEADVPLGAFLSGGIDSTIIAGLMARNSTNRVRTFSIGFSEDPRFDETHYARIASRAFDTDHTEFTLEPSSFELVERLVDVHGGPFGDSSAIPTSVVSSLTRKHVTVALTGDGGDELFCGYLRFLAIEASERIPSAMRFFGGRLAEALPEGTTDRALFSRARRFLDRAAMPLEDRLLAWHTYFGANIASIVRPEVRAKIDPDAARAHNSEVFARSAGASTLGRILQHNFETYLPEDLLVKADRSSMMHSLELRSPFLDTKLVEFVARLPDAYKRRGRSTKWILKRAFADLLPEEIRVRRKMGFGVPLATWFRGNLRDYLGDRFKEGAALYDYVEPAFVKRLFTEHMSGKADRGSELWLLLTFQVWLERMGGAATPEPLRRREVRSLTRG